MSENNEKSTKDHCKNCGSPFGDKSGRCAYCGKIAMKLPFMVDDNDIDVLVI